MVAGSGIKPRYLVYNIYTCKGGENKNATSWVGDNIPLEKKKINSNIEK